MLGTHSTTERHLQPLTPSDCMGSPQSSVFSLHWQPPQDANEEEKMIDVECAAISKWDSQEFMDSAFLDTFILG